MEMIRLKKRRLTTLKSDRFRPAEEAIVSTI